MSEVPAAILEVKTLVETMGKAHADWRAVMETKAAGSVTKSEFAEQMAKLNPVLDGLEAAKKSIEALQVAVARPRPMTKEGVELPADWNEKRKEFSHFLRKGHQDVSKSESEDLARSSFKLTTKSLSVVSDSDGGYGVHADTNGRIVKRIWETSPIRSVASTTTIGTDALEGILDVNEAAAGWVAETGVRPGTATPKIGIYRIPVHELYAMPAATQKLLDDAGFDIEAWLSEKVADKMTRVENTAFVLGNGVTQPRGFLTYPTTGAQGVANTPVGSVEQVVTGFASTLTYNSLNSTVYALKAAYRPGATWGFARGTIGVIRGLLDGFNRPLWEPSLQIGEPSRLMGYGVNEFDDMPALAANALFGAFANWREFYQIVDRTGIRILRDPFTSKPYVLFYTTKRTGGDVVNFEAGKIMKAST